MGEMDLARLLSPDLKDCSNGLGSRSNLDREEGGGTVVESGSAETDLGPVPCDESLLEG